MKFYLVTGSVLAVLSLVLFLSAFIEVRRFQIAVFVLVVSIGLLTRAHMQTEGGL